MVSFWCSFIRFHQKRTFHRRYLLVYNFSDFSTSFLEAVDCDVRDLRIWGFDRTISVPMNSARYHKKKLFIIVLHRRAEIHSLFIFRTKFGRNMFECEICEAFSLQPDSFCSTRGKNGNRSAHTHAVVGGGAGDAAEYYIFAEIDLKCNEAKHTINLLSVCARFVRSLFIVSERAADSRTLYFWTSACDTEWWIRIFDGQIFCFRSNDFSFRKQCMFQISFLRLFLFLMAKPDFSVNNNKCFSKLTLCHLSESHFWEIGSIFESPTASGVFVNASFFFVRGM